MPKELSDAALAALFSAYDARRQVVPFGDGGGQTAIAPRPLDRTTLRASPDLTYLFAGQNLQLKAVLREEWARHHRHDRVRVFSALLRELAAAQAPFALVEAVVSVDARALRDVAIAAVADRLHGKYFPGSRLSLWREGTESVMGRQRRAFSIEGRLDEALELRLHVETWLCLRCLVRLDPTHPLENDTLNRVLPCIDEVFPSGAVASRFAQDIRADSFNHARNIVFDVLTTLLPFAVEWESGTAEAKFADVLGSGLVGRDLFYAARRVLLDFTDERFDRRGNTWGHQNADEYMSRFAHTVAQKFMRFSRLRGGGEDAAEFNLWLRGVGTPLELQLDKPWLVEHWVGTQMYNSERLKLLHKNHKEEMRRNMREAVDPFLVPDLQRLVQDY